MGASAMGLLVRVTVTRYGDLDVQVFGMRGRVVPVGATFVSAARWEARQARRAGRHGVSRAWRTIRDALRAMVL